MNLIEKLSVEAKAAGMSYGQYVATLNAEQAQKYTPTEQKAAVKTCARCGVEIAYGNKKYCDECAAINRAEAKNAQTKNQKPRKEYHRKCTRCGAEVITRQSPAQSREGNLYCKACRVEVNRIQRRASYHRRKGK